jgi:hypothetical protein
MIGTAMLGLIEWARTSWQWSVHGINGKERHSVSFSFSFCGIKDVLALAPRFDTNGGILLSLRQPSAVENALDHR